MNNNSSQMLGPYLLNTVHCADCQVALQLMPDNCVDLAITSPPYWGQRGDEGIGLEKDPREYLRKLTGILMQVMRVIKHDGLLWLNIGDSYNTTINWRLEDRKYSTLGPKQNGLNKDNSAYTKNRGQRRIFRDKKVKWLTDGNLLALPYRVITSLCDQGVYFRGEVIWYKSRPMPEGRARRPHRKHEGIYILANSEKHKFTVTPSVPSVWQLQYNRNATPHTSAFPVDLPMKCIQATGLTEGIVLDPFMGSGTVGIAAKRLGLQYIGFDIDEQNVSAANSRIDSTE